MMRVEIRNGKIISGGGNEVFVHGADRKMAVDTAKAPPLRGGQVIE
jgi:hypothetical protein